MNEIVNNFLLKGNKFTPEMHLRQPGFTYSACGPFTKNKKRIKNIKETGDSKYICQNKLDKACFQHGMAYGDFNDLNRRTFADKLLRLKHIILLKIQNMIDIKELLLQWLINLLIKKPLVAVLKFKAFIMRCRYL